MAIVKRGFSGLAILAPVLFVSGLVLSWITAWISYRIILDDYWDIGLTPMQAFGWTLAVQGVALVVVIAALVVSIVMVRHHGEYTESVFVVSWIILVFAGIEVLMIIVAMAMPYLIMRGIR